MNYTFNFNGQIVSIHELYEAGLNPFLCSDEKTVIVSLPGGMKKEFPCLRTPNDIKVRLDG
ncbi:hypothetical protein J2S74_002897 [Evansella vedderi]|uniref:Uncharacterized protein n=1 Tax=Evansella vedderi TaxID=38282 RepID=A0ABT9ZX28_9BACI|nr:hypothetical protein [Evansella vedderi]MDQ0255515.1 hypothetical protein [Evansella vedderi]